MSDSVESTGLGRQQQVEAEERPSEEGDGDSSMVVVEEVVEDNVTDAIFLCSQCPIHRTFASAQLLVKHNERFHDNSHHYPYQCQQCGKPWSSNAALECHVRTHTGERPFMCKDCGKGFSQKGALKLHKRLHTGERPYVCVVCQKAFHQQANLSAHARCHAAITSSADKEVEMSGSGESTGLSLGQQQVEEEERPPEEGNGDSSMVDVEEMMEDNVTGVIFVCSQCPIHPTFASAQLLVKHYERFHVNSHYYSYQCQQCGKPWPSNAALQRHMHTHTGEKPFKCKHCGKGFSQNGTLKLHERLHTGERPYVCPVCQKAFLTTSTLTAHTRIHTGETPFSCQHCTKQFRHRANRRVHEKTCPKRPEATE